MAARPAHDAARAPKRYAAAILLAVCVSVATINRIWTQEAAVVIRSSGPAPDLLPAALLGPPIEATGVVSSAPLEPNYDHQHRRERRQSRRTRVEPSGYNSIGRVQHLRTVVDVAQPGMARHVGRVRSHRGEIIIFISDEAMSAWAYNLVLQLRSLGYEHWLMLAPTNASCDGLQRGWSPLMAAAELPLSCAWSSYPASHAGWSRWVNNDDANNAKIRMFTTFAMRFWVAWQLCKEGLNVLSVDTDTVVYAPLYGLLKSPPLSEHDVIMTANSDQSHSINCGFVYFQHPTSRAHGRLSRSACSQVDGADGSGAVPAAEWLLELFWERLTLFLDFAILHPTSWNDARSSGRAPLYVEVVWDQDIWNDILKSVEYGRRVFPWTVAYGVQKEQQWVWRQLGYRRIVKHSFSHFEKRVGWARRPEAPQPWPPPPEENAERLFNASIRLPLLGIPLCPPANVSNGVAATVPRASPAFADGSRGAADNASSANETTNGIPLGLVSRSPPRAGRFLVAPRWLASLGNDPEADWATAQPPPFASLHLTNMWHCFPHACWSKAGRLFWLRVTGRWDKRLDAAGLTPGGARHVDRSSRVLAYPPAAFAARLLELAPPMPPCRHPCLLSPAEAWKRGTETSHARAVASRRLIALIHNLVTLAVLLGRRPLMPTVPCEFLRAIQPPSSAHVVKGVGRFGVSHASAVITGTEAKQVCHLAPPAWRPASYNIEQCTGAFVAHEFELGEYAAKAAAVERDGPSADVGLVGLQPPIAHYDQPSTPWLGSRAEAIKPWEPTAEADENATETYRAALMKRLAAFCNDGSRQASSPLLLLEGMAGSDRVDVLVDRPLTDAEFATRAYDIEAVWRRQVPAWRSLLRAPELKALSSSCSGALRLDAYRQACGGAFLTFDKGDGSPLGESEQSLAARRRAEAAKAKAMKAHQG